MIHKSVSHGSSSNCSFNMSHSWLVTLMDSVGRNIAEQPHWGISHGLGLIRTELYFPDDLMGVLVFFENQVDLF